MKIIEIGTGYTSIPAKKGAATEIIIEALCKVFSKKNIDYEIFDICDKKRLDNDLNIREVKLKSWFTKENTSLGLMHKLKRIAYSIRLAKVLKNEIRVTRGKMVIHFHNQYNLFFFYKLTSKKLREKVKIMYTVHSVQWNKEWKHIRKITKLKYFQEIFCIKHADKVFVLNTLTKDNFVNYFKVDRKKIVQIGNGTDTEIYKPLKEEQKKHIFIQIRFCV